MKYDLCLIYPSSNFIENQFSIPNISMLLLQAYVKKYSRTDAKVKVIYLSEYNNNYEYIPESDTYGISVVTPNFKEAKNIYSYLKMKYKDCIVLAGGPHPTVLPETCKKVICDYPIRGAGEEIMVELFRNDWYGYYRTLSEYPIFNFSNIEKYKDIKLSYDDIEYKRYSNWLLLTDVGCYYNCNFCFKLFPKVFQFPEEFVLRCIDDYTSMNVQNKFLKLTSDNVLINFSKNEYIFEALGRYKIPYEVCGRLDNLTSNKIEVLKSTGCKIIKVGIESGSPRILEAMNKKETIDDMFKGTDLLHKMNMKFGVYLMCNYPTEQDYDRQLTIHNVSIMQPDWFSIYDCVPYPGTKIWNDLPELEKQRIIDSDFQYMYHAGRISERNEIIKQMEEDLKSEIKDVKQFYKKEK